MITWTPSAGGGTAWVVVPVPWLIEGRAAAAGLLGCSSGGANAVVGDSARTGDDVAEVLTDVANKLSGARDGAGDTGW